MRWLYYIPHTMEQSDGTPIERLVWEDLYLIPDIPDCEQSLWLTVDGYYPEDTMINGLPWEKTWLDEGELEQIEQFGFVVRHDTNDMIIKDPDFTKAELLGWAKIFLKEKGYEVSELISAPRERFEGSNQHACAVGKACEALDEYLKDPATHSHPWEELRGRGRWLRRI